MPRYVTVDLFGKVGVGKTTIFELFAGDRLLKYGGNLSYDFRGYYARCWVLPRRWHHSMVFLADPKLEWFWKDLKVKNLRKLFEPTNVLMIVTDSTKEDVMNVKNSFSIYPKIKRKLIIYVIANMQDKTGRLSPTEIKDILNMDQVLGLNAKGPNAKKKVESFIEEAAIMYFRMLSKRGVAMEILDENQIGFNKTEKEENQKTKSKYSEKLHKLRKKRMEIEEKLKKETEKEKKRRFKKIKEHKETLEDIKEKNNSND